MTIKTVLENVNEAEINFCLCHEHICCHLDYILKMAGKDYLDTDKLVEKSVSELKRLKDTYGLNLFVDCTPVNLGRDVDLLKTVSEKSGVNIVCSTGFYYTDEPVLYGTSEDLLAEYMLADIKNINAGAIKAAVEKEEIGFFNEKLLRATAITAKTSGLPVVLHTNASNKNGIKAAEILLDSGVLPEAITVGHLSDTEDAEYIKEFAKLGCYVGIDRLYGSIDEEYINKKLNTIFELCDAGFEKKILLSHDEVLFNGFETNPSIKTNPRFEYVFKYILPRLDAEVAEEIMKKNPIRMLKCE